MARWSDGSVDVELVDEPDGFGDAPFSPGPARASAALPGRPSVEDDGAPQPDGSETDAPHDPHGRHRVPAVHRGPSLGSRLRWAIPVTLLSGVAVALATTADTSADRRDDALVAAFEGAPGVSATLRDPLEERWRTPGPVTASDGLVLGVELVEGVPRTVARDAATGDTRWLAPKGLASAGTALACPAAIDGGLTLVCESPGGGGIGAGNTDALLGGSPDQLVTLDAATGEVSDALVLRNGTVGWDVVDDDLVLARRDGARLLVERTDLPSHDVVWTRTLPISEDVLARELTLTVADGFVVLEGPVAAVLDDADGVVLGQWVAPDQARAVQISTSRLGYTVFESATTTWFDKSGAAGSGGDWMIGVPWRPDVDDGSVAQTVLVDYQGSVRAVDVIDPAIRWSRAPATRVHLRIDSLLVYEDDRSVRAVDLRNGEELWSVRVDGGVAADSELLTDGLRVAIPTGGVDGAPARLTCYRLDDGTQLWSTLLPEGTTVVREEDGVIIATGKDAVVLG